MCAVSFALLALATTMDRRIAQWVHQSNIDPWMRTLPVTIIKQLGVYYCTTIPAAILVAVFHRLGIRAGLFVLMTGLVCLLGNLLKWTIGRKRPFHLDAREMTLPFSLDPFPRGFSGLITQTNLAFPSGHTMVAFATAASLAILWPRWRWIFYVGAAGVAIERVLENAHWLSDTVGAAGLAICGVHLMWRIIVPWVSATPANKIEPQPAVNLNQS